MFVFHRPVRFSDVDVARIVFFARFFDYCHDALEALFGALPGGYAHMVNGRDLGIPSVRLEADFSGPLRFGDVARFEIDVLRLGRTSATIRHVIRRDADGMLAATIRHVFVVTRLSALRPEPIPADIRSLFAAHLVEDADSPPVRSSSIAP